MSQSGGPIAAAGAVVWRPRTRATVEVALVHRPRYDDWSLPKGKAEDGEALPVTAVREVAEETGSVVALGRHLGRTSYRIGQRPKRIDYWAARERGGDFAVNEEVDDLVWLTPDQARQRTSYADDRRVLDRFAAAPTGPTTTTLLLVRHAKAGSRKKFHGDDRLRPLEADGRRQAAALAPLCAAFGPAQVHAADRVRCEQTLAPLAAELGTEVVEEPLLSEEGYEADVAGGRLRVQELLVAEATSAVCSQGGVIPDVVSWLAARDGGEPAAGTHPQGEHVGGDGKRRPGGRPRSPRRPVPLSGTGPRSS